MIPSVRWFPSSLQACVAWFANFVAQFAQIAEGLGFTGDDVTAVRNDNEMMQFIGATDTQVKAYEKAVNEFRDIITEGDIGDVTPEFPANLVLSPPPSVPTGIFERLDKLVDRIFVAPNYTSEIGALLGILPTGETPTAPENWKPVLKAKARPEFTAQVKFTRGKSDGVALHIQRDKEDNWTSFGSFFQSPAVLEIPPKTPDTPEVVQIRGRFLVGNTPTGEFSDIVEIVTEP